MMKLLTKLNIRYILYSLVVFAISGVAIYYILSVIITRQMDEQLSGSLQQIESLLKTDSPTEFLMPFAEIKKNQNEQETTVFSDTLILNVDENELEEYRQISSVKNIKGESFKIVIRKSKIESEDLLETLALVMLLAMILLTSTLILVNRKVAKSVWKSFYSNLERMKSFSLQKQEKLKLQSSNISEFSELNQILENLTNQIIADYQNLKQFTEDASHEIQTPLAIIRSKLETILNDTDLSQKHGDELQIVYSSANQLSRLNKNLIVLAKLDNKQFMETANVSFQKLINEKINDWQELIELKGIQLYGDFNNDIQLKMNLSLAEMLISNLFSNAINHNILNGIFRIQIIKNQLIVSNSGEKEIQNPKAIFNRFYKENPNTKSIGLGMAIVKKICDIYSITIQYSFTEKMHTFSIAFPL